MGDDLPPERRPGVLRRAVAHASLGGGHLRLLEHGGVAGHQDGRHRQPAHAVVPGAVGVLRLRAPGHPAADPDGGALRQGRSGQRPSGSPPRLRANTSEPPRSLLPVPDVHSRLLSVADPRGIHGGCRW